MSNRAARRRQAKHHPGRTPAAVVATVAPLAAASASAEAVEPEALVVTHYFNADALQGSATVRLTGRRVGAQGNENLQDAFTQRVQTTKVTTLLRLPRSRAKIEP